MIAEPLSAYDESCDYCARQVGMSNLRPVRIGRSTSRMCNRCHDRQEERYAAMTAAEDRIDLQAKGQL